MDRDDLLVCPECNSDLNSTRMSCPTCGFQGRVYDTIPSFIELSKNLNGQLDQVELAELADRVENTMIHEAVLEFLADHSSRSEVISEIFDVRREDWRVLVADDLSGRCLDMRAGYGRRSMLLAELVDEVYAVDSSLEKLRILAGRNDYESSDRVIPVHTQINRLPFSKRVFDSIVCDLTGHDITAVEQYVRTLSKYLDTNGSLLITIDGWPRQTGLLDQLGIDPVSTKHHKMSMLTPARIQSTFPDDEFDDFRFVALLPTAQRLRYCTEIDDPLALRRLLESICPNSHRGTILKAAIGIGDKLGLLEQSFPSYLVVGRKGATTSQDKLQFQHPVLISGRARAVILNQNDTGLTRVCKVPNRTAHESITAHEISLLKQLRTSEKPITRTLPIGTTVESRFGTIWEETPATGRPLDEHLTDDLRSFEQALDVGFEWLVDFQNTYRNRNITHSPRTIRENLTVDDLNLVPPDDYESLELFETAVHGDFLPQNIYIESGSVSSVIDWELGGLSGNPIVDPAFFVLKTTMGISEGFSDALHEIFVKDSAISRIIWDRINRYCDEVGISTKVFVTYFPYVYVRRITDDDYNTVTDYIVNNNFDRWSDYISRIWEVTTESEALS